MNVHISIILSPYYPKEAIVKFFQQSLFLSSTYFLKKPSWFFKPQITQITVQKAIEIALMQYENTDSAQDKELIVLIDNLFFNINLRREGTSRIFVTVKSIKFEEEALILKLQDFYNDQKKPKCNNKNVNLYINRALDLFKDFALRSFDVIVVPE